MTVGAMRATSLHAEEAVDFAIITARGVGREAAVRRLEAVVRVPSGDESLTFSIGSLGVPGEDQP